MVLKKRVPIKELRSSAAIALQKFRQIVVIKIFSINIRLAKYSLNAKK